jgi:hypothetical protein
MIIILIKWWYGPGWIKAFVDIKSRASGIARAFSITILLKTLFAPWKRIITYSDRSLGDKFRALLDNIVSRAVGFVVRGIVLVAALLLTLLTAVVYLLIALIWPFVPVIIMYCLWRSIIG